jgi:hypothetical protein
MALSPTSSRPSGGSTYTPPTKRGNFDSGGVVTIANSGTNYLPWHDASYPGGPVVDLTAPSTPVVLASGIYTVSVFVLGHDLTANGFLGAVLIMDDNGDGIITRSQSRLSTAAQNLPQAFVSGTYYIPVDGTIRVRAENYDGVAARDFELYGATIQRLT